MPVNSRIVATGSYLPEKIVTNDDLSLKLDTSDQWIRERTGIRQRHIASEDECVSDLAAKATKKALKNAGIPADSVDLVLLATATPDNTFPAAATLLQAKAGMFNAAAMDVNAACSGFVYGLHIADAMIKAGKAKTIVLAGSEVMSRVVDWDDRSTCVLFGDGAGAVIIKAENNDSDKQSGILYSNIESDGRYADILATNGGVSSNMMAGTLYMNGQEVFRHAVSKMSDSSLSSLKKCNLSVEDVDWVIPHQANHRILMSCAKKMKVPESKFISTVDLHANTSSASIPLAMDHSYNKNIFKKENIILLPALGAGLTWGSCIIRW